MTARNIASVRSVAEECGEGSLALPLDVCDEQACGRTVRETERAMGKLDILVNNAGIAESCKFTDINAAEWRKMLAVDLDGPFWLTQAVLPGMLSRSDGTVISIGSVASKVGLAYAVHYSAAKHGLLGMTRALAREYARSGVTFNCVCPHYVDTPMTDATIQNIMSKTGRSYEHAKNALLTPQGALIDPDQVAALCVYLASDAAKSITGQAINVDGGEVQS